MYLEDIFTEENIQNALHHVLSRKNSCGIDGIFVKDFEEYWILNGQKILKQVMNGVYMVSPVQLREIIMPTGKHRIIAHYTCTDRLITRILAESLQKEVDDSLSEYSYAYRKQRGVIKAVEQAAAYMQAGKIWVLELDIENYFDNINLTLMEEKIREIILDKNLFSLMEQYLRCEVMEEEYTKTYIKDKGLVQGCSLSPVLSNIYLNKLDQQMEKEGLPFCRFGDNINIYFYNKLEAAEWYAKIKAIIENEFDLHLNIRKSGIYLGVNRIFLGYSFKKQRSGEILTARNIKKKTIFYANWHTSALQYTGKEYHIINDGILNKKDYTLLFENEKEKKYLPVETVDKLNIYSNVIFDTGFFEMVSRYNIDISIFDKYGKHCGTFCGSKHARTSDMIIKQASLYNNDAKRLSVAKSILIAAAHNMRANVRYYVKKEKLKKENVDKLSAFIKKLNDASSISNLMMIEAQCRQSYYTYMGKIIGDGPFHFAQRTKRPPRDAVNAMISFGNVFLYEKIATEIYKTSLDIKVGFLHSTNRRKATLNLDIAEIFKPVIVDRVIFTVIHKRILDVSRHFESQENNGIYLDREGKRLFINELMRKMYTKITVDRKLMTYEALIRNEIWKIYRMIERGEPYKPYKYT